MAGVGSCGDKLVLEGIGMHVAAPIDDYVTYCEISVFHHVVLSPRATRPSHLDVAHNADYTKHAIGSEW